MFPRLASCFALLVLTTPLCLAAKASKAVEPLPYQETILTRDQVVDFLEKQKKGTPIEITLEKGKVIKGLFSSYDDYYDTVWIIPQSHEQGMFKEKSVKVAGIKNVVLWDKKSKASSAPTSEPPLPGMTTKSSGKSEDGIPDEYYLLKESGVK